MARKELILDMALKAVSDMSPVLDKNSELVHIAGGDCRDAVSAKIIAIEIMHRATRVRLPDHIKQEIDELVETGYQKVEADIASAEAKIAAAIEERRDDLIKVILGKVLGVDPSELEIESMKLPKEKLH